MQKQSQAVSELLSTPRPGGLTFGGLTFGGLTFGGLTFLGGGGLRWFDSVQ